MKFWIITKIKIVMTELNMYLVIKKNALTSLKKIRQIKILESLVKI